MLTRWAEYLTSPMFVLMVFALFAFFPHPVARRLARLRGWNEGRTISLCRTVLLLCWPILAIFLLHWSDDKMDGILVLGALMPAGIIFFCYRVSLWVTDTKEDSSSW